MTPIHAFHLVRALITGAALVLVVFQAEGRPSWVEAVVIAAIVGVLTFQLRELSRRLRAAEGEQEGDGVLRITLIWAAGLALTLWLDSADRGGWREYLGWFLLLCALLGTGHLFLRERAAMRGLGEDR